MKKLRSLTIIYLFGLAMVFLLSPMASAEEGPPIKIVLGLDPTITSVAYGPEEPIEVRIRVYNAITGEVIAREGFKDISYNLAVAFTDPDGDPVDRVHAIATNEPGPMLQYDNQDMVPVETIEAGWTRSVSMGDAREYYHLGEKYGWYTGQVRLPLEVFTSIFATIGGKPYSLMTDSSGELYNPIFSNEIRFEIAPPIPLARAALEVHVDHLKISGGSHPGATKTPIEYARVRLYRQSDLPEEDYPTINWKVYAAIWQSGIPPVASLNTNAQGVVNIENIVQDAYVVLAQPPGMITEDFKHLGSMIAADDPDWTSGEPIAKHLMLIEKSTGKKVPGKTTKRKGSLLLITEPEFVEWDSTQETYPFVFETIGDWEISTAVEPPEGFEADFKELDATGNNGLEAVQFTVTDVGSSWVETGVEFKIKHKNKTEKIKSKIGIKLTKRLAKMKKLGPYGETKVPGPFKGGRKVNDKDKDEEKKDKDK